MTKAHPKTANLSFRISADHKRLIGRAAGVVGVSTSEFVRRTLVEAASQVLCDQPVIHLTKDEWDRFQSSLDRPATEPGDATRRAVEMFNLGHGKNDRQVW